METNRVKVVGFMGSPRIKGNTNALVDAVLAGAASVGAETVKVNLTAKNIQPCTACDHCHRTGKCIHDDQMAELIELMLDSTVWVLGTPVYWWGPSAQMKTFVDRWYQVNEKLAALENRRVILAIPMGDSDAKVARHTVGMFQESMDYLNQEIVSVILAPGVNDLGQIEQHPEFLKAAFLAGQNAVNR